MRGRICRHAVRTTVPLVREKGSSPQSVGIVVSGHHCSTVTRLPRVEGRREREKIQTDFSTLTSAGAAGGSVAESRLTLCDSRLLCPWDSPGKNTGAGCCFLLQGLFLTQGLNLGLLHRKQILH